MLPRDPWRVYSGHEGPREALEALKPWAGTDRESVPEFHGSRFRAISIFRR